MGLFVSGTQAAAPKCLIDKLPHSKRLEKPEDEERATFVRDTDNRNEP
jgi:hypothetical protein